LSISCRKLVNNQSKSCQKDVKKIVKKLSKRCQKAVKKLVKILERVSVCVIVCVFPKGVIAAAHTALVISRELSHMLRLDTITIIITVTVRVI
jgi:hypothetical protein